MAMQEYIDKAKILIEALPYINLFKGKTVVIKYGGSALVNNSVKNSIIEDIALMKFVGMRPVVIHGGGADISQMLSRVGIKTDFVNSMRVTDAETMEIVEMVLAGKINKQLTTELGLHGVQTVGICGKDGKTLTAKKMEIDGCDLGYVGDVTDVNTTLIETLLDNDFVPVISSIGTDESGQSYNINADYAAVAIAGALNAEKLVFLTDVAGILMDIDDPNSLVTHVSEPEINEMLNDGRIKGGMIPKVKCCMAGVSAGVQNVHILDGRIEHSLILEIFTKEGIGTMIYRR